MIMVDLLKIYKMIYKSLITNSNVKLEDRIRYEAVLKNLFILETNYNKVINEPKHI